MDYFAIGEDKSLKNLNDIESWEKLWENPNPSSITFVAQTITLSKNLSYGDEIAILTGSGAIFMGKVTRTSGNVLHLSETWHDGGPTTPAEYLYILTRIVDFSGGMNTMVFSDCYLNTLKKNGDNWPQTPLRDCIKGDGNLIPIAIYRRISSVFK